MHRSAGQFRRLRSFFLATVGGAICFTAMPAHAQFPWRAVDDLDRTLREYGEVWVRAERARLLAPHAQSSTYRLCTTPWPSWGTRLDAPESIRLFNQWNQRQYDAREDYDVL